MMSLLAMSLGLRFCVSRKGGTGEVGGWVHLKGANSMAASGLVLRSDLVSTGRAISILFGINGVRNKRSHLPFPEFKAHFSAMAGWHFSRDLTRRLLIGGCGHSTYLLWLKLPLGAVLSLIECENDLEKKTRTPKS